MEKVEKALEHLLDDIDDAAQRFSRDEARELIERLRDEMNLRANDFDGYFGEAR